MKKTLKVLLPVLCLLLISGCNKINSNGSASSGEVSAWITAGDRSVLFEESPLHASFGNDASGTVIDVDSAQVFQAVDGFGYALTGGSAFLIHRNLSQARRTSLLKELFATDAKNIGISYLRISVGASDLDDHVFTYDDLPAGHIDEPLDQFSLLHDKADLIPVLKEILAINPNISIMASPWSAPAWMKTSGNLKGGSLKKEFYNAYAQYFIKYIQAMSADGIAISAITLQNEPENPKNNPSMLMTAEEQAEFAGKYLGPAFERAGVKTKIIVFDHNCDHPEYPIAVLDNPDAKKYVDGAAFHLYVGHEDAMTKVHTAHPDRNIYFTEQWTSPHGDFGGDLQWHTEHLIIGATSNWSKSVLEWNLAADPNFNPHTDNGGCTECLGALTIGASDSVTRNVSYYIIAHAAKYVRPGSVRIRSVAAGELKCVAFLNPSGQTILIVLNPTENVYPFGIRTQGRTARVSLPAKSVGTFVW